jgi:hypothetical protein
MILRDMFVGSEIQKGDREDQIYDGRAKRVLKQKGLGQRALFVLWSCYGLYY